MDDKFERIDSSYQATTRIGYANTSNPLETNASLVEDYTCFTKESNQALFAFRLISASITFSVFFLLLIYCLARIVERF